MILLTYGANLTIFCCLFDVAVDAGDPMFIIYFLLKKLYIFYKFNLTQLISYKFVCFINTQFSELLRLFYLNSKQNNLNVHKESLTDEIIKPI